MLVSPADETSTRVKDLIFQWKPVAGASKYQLEIGRNQDWTNNTVYTAETMATVYEMPEGLPHASYYWRVRAMVGGTWGGFSKDWRFLHEWELPIQVLQTPSSANPTLEWAPVYEASEYYVIFSTSPVSSVALANQVGGCFTNATSFTPGFGGVTATGEGTASCGGEVTDGTSYYWGVAPFDDTTASAIEVNGATGCGAQLPECDAPFEDATGGPFIYKNPSGGSGSVSGLTTSWHANTALSNSCDFETPCPLTPTFSWTPVTGANTYNVLVYLDPDATTTYREYTAQYPTFTPPDSYQDAQPGDPDAASGKPYFWQVEAAVCGGTGVLCTPPPAANQTCPTPTTTGSAKAPTVAAVTVSPSGPSGKQSMQGGTTGTVTITGSGVAAGACVVPSAGVVTSIPTVTTNADMTESVSFSFNAPVPGGNVTFQVENPDGSISGASPQISVASSEAVKSVSAISSFKKRSGPVILTSPADGATEDGHSFTFHWRDYITGGSQGSEEVKNYELQVSRDDSFAAPVLDVSGIDLTQYTDSTGGLGSGHYFWRVVGHDESDNQLTWSTTRQFAINATGPQVSITTKSGVGILHPLHIHLSDVVKGVSGRTVKIVPDGESVSHAVAGSLRLGSSAKQYVFTPAHPFATGGTYDVWVSHSLVDSNGNAAEVSGSPVRISTTAKNGSRGWNYSHGWHRLAASGALSGSYVTASGGHTASVRIEGDLATLYACKGPDMGSVTVTVAGHSKTVSENQSFTRCGVPVWHLAIPSGVHTLRVRVASGTGNLDEVKVS
ncbi:MAG TPA: hypothetical protein VG650_00160 [Mycobacteriales bacterium]|nr:hypothetical protein [Mycobacteriales bacterium]